MDASNFTIEVQVRDFANDLRKAIAATPGFKMADPIMMRRINMDEDYDVPVRY